MLFLRGSTFALLLAAATSSTSYAVGAAADNGSENRFSLDIMSKFHNWMTSHEKQYEDEVEKLRRLKIWVANDERITKHNSATDPTPDYTVGHNTYSDWTQDEFHQYYKLGQHAAGAGGGQAQAQQEQVQQAAAQLRGNNNDNELTQTTRRALEETPYLDLPDYVNWVYNGAVTDIKNQGMCGSCWAFSTTGALEGAKYVKTGELVALSEQNLIDCDHTDLGCSGGLMDNAFKFDEKTGGLCSEADYPYAAKQHKQCSTNCTDVPGTIVSSFVDVPPGNTKALLSAIAMQPISVAIEASEFAFQFYKTGVITDNSCGKRGSIDHGVLAVGYGTDLATQQPYFLVKNSWGEKWGDQGFVKIGRNTTNKFGICSILKLASFPIVEA